MRKNNKNKLLQAHNDMSKVKLPRIIPLAATIAAATMYFAFTPVRPQSDKWTAPPEASKVTNPVASNSESIAEGKKLYTKICADCHGKKGKGDGPKCAELDKVPGDFTKPDFQKQTDGSLFWKITTGKKPMPSLKKELTEEQRWQVINYIRTLGSK